MLIGFIVMGNKITYHSPSRGSSMEMGAAITVMVFSQYKLRKYYPSPTARNISDKQYSCVYYYVHYWCHCWCRSL